MLCRIMKAKAIDGFQPVLDELLVEPEPGPEEKRRAKDAHRNPKHKRQGCTDPIHHFDRTPPLQGRKWIDLLK